MSCDASSGWVWVVGPWDVAANTCDPSPPPVPRWPPTDFDMAGGKKNVGCDDTFDVVKTGAYTLTGTWNRSIDGRGSQFGMVLRKRVETLVWDGVKYNMTAHTDYNVNYTVRTLHFCF